MYATVAHKGHRSPTGRRPANAMLLIRRQLFGLLAGDVVNVEVVSTSAVRNEIDLIAYPHRLVVVVTARRQFVDCPILKICQPDLSSRSAAIKTPVANPAHRRIGDS